MTSRHSLTHHIRRSLADELVEPLSIMSVMAYSANDDDNTEDFRSRAASSKR